MWKAEVDLESAVHSRVVYWLPEERTPAFCLSFSLSKWLFSEGHGPKTVLRTSHMPSHEEPTSWRFHSQCTGEERGEQR